MNANGWRYGYVAVWGIQPFQVAISKKRATTHEFIVESAINYERVLPAVPFI